MSEKNKFNSAVAFAIVMSAIVRIFISVMLGTWFPAGQVCDDALMIGYVPLKAHFSNPLYYSLLKDMSYPVLINFFSYTGLSYTVMLGMLWVLAALSVYFLVKRLSCGKTLISFFMYIYVLFLPQAYDVWCGTRMYRNAIISPFSIMTLSLIIFMVIRTEVNGVFKYIELIVLGLLFTFTYYIKEDGMWLLACLVFAMIVGLGHIYLTDRSEAVNAGKVKKALSLFIPLFVFIILTLGYKAINSKFFEVFEINTRVGGEYGKFVEQVYKASSDNRSLYVWTPADAIEDVFNASPTLRENPKVLDAVIHSTTTANDIYEEPIPGDHLGWRLRDALRAAKLYKSEKEVNDFFRQVNKEIDEAYKNGTLKKQEGVVQILSSAGGYTVEEIKGLKDEVKQGYAGAIMMSGITPGIGPVSDDEILENIKVVDIATKYTHLDYLENYSKQAKRTERIVPVLNKITLLYKYVNIVFCLLTCGIILFEIVKFFLSTKTLKTFWQKRVKITLKAMTSLVFLGISMCYVFFIGWFSAFLFEDGINQSILNFYNIALPGILTFAYVFAILTLNDEIENLKDRRKADE